VSNTEAIGRVLYTDYILLFQAAGLVLLVAMIGAIVLTLRGKPVGRRQRIAAQVARTPANTLVLMHVATGAGTNETGFLRPEPDVVELEPEPADDHGHGHGHGGGH